MKKHALNLFKISALLMFVLVAFSCEREEETPTPTVTNYFKIGDTKYEIKSVTAVNKGETDNGFNLDLFLYCSGEKDYVNFKITSEQAENISDMTYTDAEGAWVLGYNTEDGSSTSQGSFESGELKISRSSAGYTIDFECKDLYGNNVKGHYKGKVTFKDENNLVHSVPYYVLPDEIYEEVISRIPIYSGVTPPNMAGEYVSSPHILFYESYAANPDSIQYYSNRYIGFIYDSKQMNFYGKQDDVEEICYGVKITGEGDSFTCYYVVDGYPGGYYAQQSFIFSGIKTADGLKDFHTAVILLETSGNPSMPAKNSYRVLKDEDGLAENDNWLSKRSNTTTKQISDEDLFKMWMK